MTKIYPVGSPSINLDDDAFLGGRKWTYQEEGAGQTFLKNAPLIFSAGQVVEAASPVAVGTLMGFAMEDATGVAGTLIKTIDVQTVLAFGGVEANLVVSVNPIVDEDTWTLAEVIGVAHDLVQDPPTGFWVAIPGAGAALLGWDRKSSFLFPDEEEDRAEPGAPGDTNPRIYFKLIDTIAV